MLSRGMRSIMVLVPCLVATACCSIAPPSAPEQVEDLDPEWAPIAPLPAEPPPIVGTGFRPDGLPTDVALAHAVHAINDVCPDTFCEGDFYWVFDSLTCRLDVCTLAFHVRAHADERGPIQADSVEVTGWTSILVVHGGTVELSESFWGAVSDAILRWETAERGEH